MRATLLVVFTALAVQPAAAKQRAMDRERARPHYLTAWEYMRVEAWPEAAKSFQQAIDVDPEFEDAFYGLGLADMRMKRYGEAVTAYTKCRDLYRAQAGREFTNRQEAQRYRQDRLTEIDEVMRQIQQGPQTAAMQERLRQLQEQRRQIQEYLTRGSAITVGNSVPAFVSLALGSAYFRLERWPDAERAYKEAIAADPRTGEAHNNLAVVYLLTERYREAEAEVRAAEKAGYKVPQGLKDDIRKKMGS